MAVQGLQVFPLDSNMPNIDLWQCMPNIDL